MSVDTATVKRVASLARIAVDDQAAERMTGELNAILGFVEQLGEVNVEGVEPMTSVMPTTVRSAVSTKMRTPAEAMALPPIPQKKIAGFDRRNSATSLAPCWSPDASPATIMTHACPEKAFMGGLGSGSGRFYC